MTTGVHHINPINTKQEWESTLNHLGNFDFYHTFDYHAISKSEGEEPVLLTFRDGDQCIVLPLLIRRIPDSDYRDATSVYGYAGPICKEAPSKEDIHAFQKGINQYFDQNKIISVFSRLNPFIDHQQELIAGLGSLTELGKLVNINLQHSLEEQRSQYRRDTRSRVNKLRRTASVRRAETPEDIAVFIEIYIETMKKLEADEYYFFDEAYFYSFLDCDGFKTEILLAQDNETGAVTAGSMFVMTNDIVQYHLSGTKPEHMRNAPMRLLLDEMRVKATEGGFKHFNLGGGYQCQEDALYNFKASFSEEFRLWYIWKYIVNKDVYKALVKKSANAEDGYFPAYRSPVK